MSFMMKWYGSYDVLDNEGFTETSRLANLKDQRTRVEEAAKRTQRKEWSLKRLEMFQIVYMNTDQKWKQFPLLAHVVPVNIKLYRKVWYSLRKT